ncbi:hypothetical protein [Deinococcus phoenicis]|nr:hypothetical protein [Deinococcus phoenicis]
MCETRLFGLAYTARARSTLLTTGVFDVLSGTLCRPDEAMTPGEL